MATYKEMNTLAKQGDTQAQAWIARTNQAIKKWQAANPERVKENRRRLRLASGLRSRQEYLAALEEKARREARPFRQSSAERVAAARARKPISEFKRMRALAEMGWEPAIEYIKKKYARQRAYKQKIKAKRLATA